ncbi:MAG: 50S ribosomal protein L15 [Candidatus Korarchaeum sp.]|nr:50S ribosomal protein L15 [Candidatus Korarchaeum sp.]MDW8035441.1 uL15m family ribosomal protein [Candidatus Korarchaeum sp.]
MMSSIPRRRKKSRKMRGSRLHGYGIQRQHRKSGRRGGFGIAGTKKHLWTWVTAYEPDYFGRGRRGFKRPRAVIREVRSINLSELDEILPELISSGIAKELEDGRLELDLSRIGYNKLLGRGSVSRPIVVKVDSASKHAISKLESIGGSVVLSVEVDSE